MSSSSSKVHRVRFYNPKPQPISCASHNKSSKQLALARGDASIEIWDLNHSPYLLKCIPSIENGSVEAVCWVNDRLLSTGLSGALVEWDLDRLVIKNTTMLTGSAAWCLDVSPDNTLIAAGTEKGYINLFNVEYESIQYDKLFDKQEGRILCCKFDMTGKVLATGSIDTIRVWNVAKGLATGRISVKRRNNEVIVWCLAFVSDTTLVSGDSLGRLSFWDTNLCDQIESFTTHKADITALAVTENGQNLYCSGVDPIILHFTKVAHSTDHESKAKHQWVKNVQRHIHEHDVRVLETLGERELISAGVDGYLTFSSFPPKWIMRMPPMLPPPRTALCSQKKLLLLRFSNHLEVWKLGTFKDAHSIEPSSNTETTEEDKNKEKANGTENNSVEQDSTDAVYKNASKGKKGISLEITEHPVKLISVQTKKKRQMLCCELSPTGEYIFYSTISDLRLLKLEITDNDKEDTSEKQNGDQDDQSIFLSKLAVSGVKAPCDRAAFSEDSRLLVVHGAGVMTVLQVDPDVGATVVQTINTDKFFKAKTLLHLVISQQTPTGATYLVAADTRSGLAIWTLKGKKFEHYASLPTYQCVPSALSIHSEAGLLYIIYVDQTIVEYTLASRTFAEWPASVLPESWRCRTAPVHAVRAHPARDALVLQDQNSLWVVEKQLRQVSTSNKKSKHNAPSGSGRLFFKIVPIKYLAGFHWLNKHEAVTVELLPANILAQLPPVVAQKKH